MGWSIASQTSWQTEGRLQKVTSLRCYTASSTNSVTVRNTSFPLFRYHEDTGIYILKKEIEFEETDKRFTPGLIQTTVVG